MSTRKPTSPMALALRLYDDHPLGVRAFVRTRHLLCPMPDIERHVPTGGRILDLGCGHGLFSAVLAVSSQDRSIVGVDPSYVKIDAAVRLADKLSNVEFMQGTIDDFQEGNLDAVTIVDVLYLLPPAEKERVLRRVRELLAPGGRLILKTNDTHPVWKYRWARFQEVVMTGLGLTMGGDDLHFFACTETAGLLRQVGFRDVQVVHLPTLLPYPHTLFSCLK